MSGAGIIFCKKRQTSNVRQFYLTFSLSTWKISLVAASETKATIWHWSIFKAGLTGLMVVIFMTLIVNGLVKEVYIATNPVKIWLHYGIGKIAPLQTCLWK